MKTIRMFLKRAFVTVVAGSLLFACFAASSAEAFAPSAAVAAGVAGDENARPEESEPPEENEQADKKLVVIDAGHQSRGNGSLEPIGPGATKKKPKVSAGTRGRATGLAEYELNLKVALKLQKKLEASGYDVLMIRTTNDVNISNSERAGIANRAKADAFIRIHANGSENASKHGIMTVCQTKKNPYNGDLYDVCRALSEAVLEGAVKATGASNCGVLETDSMSGINWCRVPVTILEMGFMSNSAEDRRMASDEYQNKIVQGTADGLARFFEKAA